MKEQVNPPPAQIERGRGQVSARRNVKSWKMRIVSNQEQVIMEMPDIEAGVRGFLSPRLLNGATVYVGGAVNPLTAGCLAVVAHPAPRVTK